MNVTKDTKYFTSIVNTLEVLIWPAVAVVIIWMLIGRAILNVLYWIDNYLS